MNFIESVQDLEAIYGEPGETSLIKVAPKMTDGYRAWIFKSKLCILSTVGPEGTDASPRGDEQSVVTEIDEQTLALPDWRGNNRIDSLKNIVRDERVSLMFFVGGSDNVIRVNGVARVTIDQDMIERFERGNHHPRSVIIIKIKEIYSQCARALIRSKHWTDRADLCGLPTIGELMKEVSDSDFDAKAYDEEWPERAAKSMW